MDESASSFTSANPIVQKILSGEAAPPIKLAAARGALPIPPEELIHVLHHLHGEGDAEVSGAIRETVAGLDDEALAGLLRNPDLPPGLIAFFAHLASAREPVVLAMIGNRATGDGTLLQLATSVGEAGIELLVTNQVALIRTPEIMDTLLDNPAISTDQSRRVRETREEFIVKRELEEKRRQDEAARLEKIREKETWTQAELEKLTEDLARETAVEKESGTLAPDPEDLFQVVEADAEHQSATQKIMGMSVPEKVLLAIRGSRTERGILIRDSNRMVAVATIKSPKLTDAEVENIAGLRNVNDEVLRILGAKREWMRNYNTLLILLKNPRCPIPVAMNLLPRVQKRDIKGLTSDRNISEVIRRQARTILEKAEKGHRG